MCDQQEFISDNDTTEADIQAADRGELVPWRISADGVQWYRRIQSDGERPTIMAVPPAAADATADFGDDDPDDDTDIATEGGDDDLDD